MNINKTILFQALIILFGLQVGCTTKDSNGLITIDVTKNYPDKKLWIHDIADVEYLILELDDNYLFSHILGISDNFVICGNHVDNSFLFFSRQTGKPMSKIDRYGNGPEEYNLAVTSVYSEKNDEFFILDYPIGIKVYGRDGTYKRKLEFRERSYIGGPEALYDYDENNLIYYDGFQGSINNYPTAFVMISKKDGRISKEIQIPYEKKISLMFTRKSDGNVVMGTMPKVFFAVRDDNDFLLTEYSTDTVYRFTADQKLIPVLVRKPSIQTMTSKTILHSWLDTKDYIFFTTNNLEVDWSNPGEFQEKGYILEKSTGDIHHSYVEMNDYKGKIITLGPSVISRSLRDSQTGYVVLTSQELFDADKDGKINGILKEKVDHLTEYDEFVVMILRFRK